MTLYEKILTIYSDLASDEFLPGFGTIELRNDSDGGGDYIYKWEHPTYPRPTQEQLDGIE